MDLPFLSILEKNPCLKKITQDLVNGLDQHSCIQMFIICRKDYLTFQSCLQIKLCID